MKKRTVLYCLLFVLCVAGAARAQETQTAGANTARPVSLTEAAVATNANGQQVLTGSLLSAALTGPPEVLTENARIIIENRSSIFYTYVSGYATFYDADGVRVGEGLWTLNVLAPGERVRVDTPGLRLTAKPVSWRLTATNLLTRSSDATSAANAAAARTSANATTNARSNLGASNIPPLVIEINGATLPIQLGNPIEVEVGRERVRIRLTAAPQ